jgi:hypothetical protein
MAEAAPEPAVAEPAPTSAEPAHSRGRAVAAVVCLVLAAILTVPAGFAYWGQRTINDGDRYVATVGPLVDSPEVRTAIATKVTDAIEQQVDVEALLNQAFSGVIADRPRLQLLVGPLAGAVNGLIQTQVQNFIDSDAFRQLWLAVNTRAQERLIQLLKGEDSGAVSVQGGEVVLDLSTVVDEVKQQLVDRGLTFVQNAPPIPAADQQIVLLDSPQLKQVRTIYAFTNPVAKWLLPVVGLLYLGGLLLSRRRPRATVIIGVLIAANGLLLALALSVGRQLFVNELSGTVFGPASSVFYDTLLSYLERGQRVLVWLGLILVVVGWFAGGTRFGTAVRTTTCRFLESAGAPLAGTSVAGAGRWTLANALWLRIVVAVLGVVVLLWGNNVSGSRLFWSVVLVLVLLAAIQVLVGTGRAAGGVGAAEDGDRTPTEPLPTASTGGSARTAE